jgi:Flp pilus assembly protein TadG
MVEFALILPVLVLLALGAVDVAKAINYWNDSTHLASEAARYAAVNNSPQKNPDGTPVVGSLATAIATQADTPELASSVHVYICFPPPSTGQVGDEVRVTVDSIYNWSAVLVPLNLNSHITASATMRIEKKYENLSPSTDAYTTGSYDAGTKKCGP